LPAGNGLQVEGDEGQLQQQGLWLGKCGLQEHLHGMICVGDSRAAAAEAGEAAAAGIAV
jgi:hypothetical protein